MQIRYDIYEVGTIDPKDNDGFGTLPLRYIDGCYSKKYIQDVIYASNIPGGEAIVMEVYEI